MRYLVGCVYVALADSGVIKIGKTHNPRFRKNGIAHQFRKMGWVLDKFIPFDKVNHTHYAEFILIERLRVEMDKFKGREWFTGQLDTALIAAKEVTEETIEKFGIPKTKKAKQKAQAIRRKVQVTK